jgi:aspartate aminotransferase
MTTFTQDTGIATKDVTSVPQISARAKSTQDSPIRKLSATAEARKQKGTHVYHLNIGQPDLPTPQIVFDTIRDLKMKTLAYAPSNGLPQALQAWKAYFGGFGLGLDEKEIIVTAGGSEAIVFAMCAV